MKVKFGSIITDGRGTLGGHVYSRNHYGPFARTKVSPFNPQTTRQQTVRTVFQNVQLAWHQLTEHERELWTLASPDYPKTDFSGTVYYLTGYNLFISINVPYYTYAGVWLTEPPTRAIPTSDCNGSLVVNFGGSGLTFTFDNDPNETNVYIQFWATRPLSPGVEFVSTALRLIGSDPADGTHTRDLTSLWQNAFGTDPVSGQKIFCKFVPLNIATGDYGIPFTFSGIQ